MKIIRIETVQEAMSLLVDQPYDEERKIQKLGLSDKETSLFKEKASADRGRLPNEQMDYLLKHRKLLDLINYGLENNVNDKRWAEMLIAISGGK